MKCSLSDKILFKFCNNELNNEVSTDIELHINYCFECQLRFIGIWDSIKDEGLNNSTFNKANKILEMSWNERVDLNKRVMRASDKRIELRDQKDRLKKQRLNLKEQRETIKKQKEKLHQFMLQLKENQVWHTNKIF
jgi:hypothetical protein